MKTRLSAFLSGLGIALTLGVIVVVPSAQAVTKDVGYFGNVGVFNDATMQHGAVIQSCSADPNPVRADMTNKAEFIRQILAYYNNNDGCNKSAGYWQTKNHIGAAFVIQTMRGVAHPAGSYDLSAADIQDWKDRVNNSEISVSFESITFTINSAYISTKPGGDGLRDDIFFDQASSEAMALVFRDSTGKTLYQLKGNCANPVGDMPGLPTPVPKHYYLTPTVSIVPNAVVEPGAIVTVTTNVRNTGNINSPPVPWVVSRFTLPAGGSVPAGDSAGAPSAYYGGSGWTSIGGDGGGIFAPGNTNPGSPTNVTPDVPAGTLVCYALSVQKYTDDPVTNDWRHSAASCVKVGKKPKLQVLGGDLISRGTVTGGAIYKNRSGTNYMFGSWVEYGIFATGTISQVGSGSAYSGTGLAANPGDIINCTMSRISFSNAGSTTCGPTTEIGRYAYGSQIPDVAASFPATGAPSFGGGDLANQAKTGIFTSGNINLTGGTIDKGRWVVINAPTADITISGNIIYFNGTLLSVADIPQVVIIAHDINITGNVTQIDAWLIAKGTLNTCSDVPIDARLNIATCNQPLVINGPVMAGQLYPRRTGGSGTGADRSGDPAETFNLRPDAYMWASARATGDGRIQTVYTTELPPRL